MSDIILERLIAASPATVFSFFTNLERWTSWQGVDGELDPQPDGILRIVMPGGEIASGRILELIPERKIVFSWGWEGEPTPLKPGASTVTIELEPTAGGTRLRLTHSGIESPEVADHHRQGWQRYLERLHTRAEGRDPGPDQTMERG